MSRMLRQLEKSLEQASCYEEWKEIAQEHDSLSGADAWKQVDRSTNYDYELIGSRLQQMRRARKQDDAAMMIFHLQEGLHGNLGNISNSALYQHSLFGTKTLITRYLDEIVASLNYLCDTDLSKQGFTLEHKREFFKQVGQTFGQSCLMLSGGGALGLFHIGAGKALWEQGLLPTVISGSSAGSIIASVLGTTSDDNLKEKLQPESIYLNAFRYVGWTGLLKGRPVLDGNHLESCLEENIADLTFEEAFQQTGREINITVSPYDRHQHARLLNWRTAPNVLIRKASLASCAIPGIYPPVTLWAKNIDGDKVPYIPTRKWVDGSVKDDLPIRRLGRLYGVNHSIVSQTNPHVVPFLARKGEGRLLASAGNLALRNITMNARYVINLAQRQVASNDIGLLLDKGQSILRQRYIGDINIIPPRRPLSVLRTLTNATPKDVENYIHLGERATWPQIEMIRNTTKISRAFRDCLQRVEAQEPTHLQTLKLIKGWKSIRAPKRSASE